MPGVLSAFTTPIAKIKSREHMTRVRILLFILYAAPYYAYSTII
jgi:hypothetical protein